MNTIILLIIPLLVLAPTMAYATNEGSYLYGKKQGRYDWESCTTYADKDGNYPACDGLGFSCDPSNSHVFVRNQTTGLLDQSNSVIVTNQTACSDGYIHAWNHVCDQDKARNFF